MADAVMADANIEEREKEEILTRPFHEACLTNKVLCPMAECLEHFRVFKESGLDHHFENLCICREIDGFAEETDTIIHSP